ncbi:hypothetical protein HCN44_009974 [Aphidius gifuensis]|uniref:Uncharacterized protein n=1 Tax=Aphidius gifuensis TaxID=684658 RepID=A0A834Y856_APHGI|nr:hypothetical protein HCN44_009974 [Aphidius gifuensis]
MNKTIDDMDNDDNKKIIKHQKKNKKRLGETVLENHDSSIIKEYLKDNGHSTDEDLDSSEISSKTKKLCCRDIRDPKNISKYKGGKHVQTPVTKHTVDVALRAQKVGNLGHSILKLQQKKNTSSEPDNAGDQLTGANRKKSSNLKTSANKKSFRELMEIDSVNVRDDDDSSFSSTKEKTEEDSDDYRDYGDKENYFCVDEINKYSDEEINDMAIENDPLNEDEDSIPKFSFVNTSQRDPKLHIKSEKIFAEEIQKNDKESNKYKLKQVKTEPEFLSVLNREFYYIGYGQKVKTCVFDSAQLLQKPSLYVMTVANMLWSPEELAVRTSRIQKNTKAGVTLYEEDRKGALIKCFNNWMINNRKMSSDAVGEELNKVNDYLSRAKNGAQKKITQK